MMRISKISFLILIFFFPFTLSSQEIVSGLQGNITSEKYYRNSQKLKKAEILPDTLELPFIDDFSDSEVEPKETHWSDHYAFINSDYAINPPSAGVATLDALDYNGSHYPNAGSVPYNADSLTSQPVNLNYPPSDSIYLSLYYQPGGLAEPPETGDSLMLDFYGIYTPDSAEWKKVWSVPGTGSSEEFKRVMIKIEAPEYLKKGFRFRFRNYASQLSNNDLFDKRANVDHWHIDYVKLDRNRQISDTVLRDVAFTEPVKSILKDYTSLPWSHFQSAYNTQRAPYIEVVLKNHDRIPRNVGTILEIKDILRYKPVYKVPVYNNNITSGDSIHYKYSYNYQFDFAPVDSAAFEIRTIIQTDFFDYKPNDTLHYIQKFFDYYALDDGTAEASYGLRGDGTKDASSALKFNSYLGDTLRAIDIYFVQLVDSLNLDYYFYLNVWDDNNGKPGNKLINQIGMRPVYSDKLNNFVRYRLESPVYIEGIFYIGFTQTVERLLNVGLDMNHKNQARIFNNSDNGVWNTTTVLEGTPMMHPVFRKNPISGYQTIKLTPFIHAYPNPANELIRIAIDNPSLQSKKNTIDLIDIYGRIVRTVISDENCVINTSELPDGIYFLRVNDPALKQISTIKIIIKHQDG